jgi:polar amino acid transport system substrate-binding protein
MIRGVITILAGGLAALLSGPVAALELVTGPDYPPWTDEKLPGGGVSVEIVRAVFAEMAEPLAIAVVPWKRGYEETLTGRYVGTFPYVRTADREALFQFSDPIAVSRQLVFAWSGSMLHFEQLGDLEGFTVCSAVGSALPPEIGQRVAAGVIKLIQPGGSGDCARMVAFGRADFFVINEQNGRAALREAKVPPEAVRTEPKPFATVSHHLIIPKTRDGGVALMARFNLALGALKDRGVVDRLLESRLGGS